MAKDEEEKMKPAGVAVPKSMLDKIDAQLEYGDSRSEWIREAIRMRLDAEQDDQ